ncbi:type IX secretion system membrane protein PorP/SprF [Flavobacteriales bacterium]|nr:type IX secretion system membrane protein PorP/SprF [Flavobacteriales bacterium]
MKRISILLFAICFGGILKAQQLPQITQYMNNNYVVNPAVAGMYDYYQVNTTIRNQWAGINDAPRTSVISVYGKHSENVGLGGTVYNDVTGPTSRSGAAVSYTYAFSIISKMKLSLALQGGFTQFKIIRSGLSVENQQDPLMMGGDVVRVLPDATFGLNLSGNKWYIGAAIPQLLSSELRLMDDNFARLSDTTSQNGKLARHIYVLGSYTYDINSSISVEPSFFLKSVSGAKTQIDIGLKSEYKGLFWLGMSYKMDNDFSSMAALLGFDINDRYNIGYSYGMPSSSTSSYHSGSHEFMLGVRLPN